MAFLGIRPFPRLDTLLFLIKVIEMGILNPTLEEAAWAEKVNHRCIIYMGDLRKFGLLSR